MSVQAEQPLPSRVDRGRLTRGDAVRRRLRKRPSLRVVRRSDAIRYDSPLVVRASRCAAALRHVGGQTLVGLIWALIEVPYLVALLCVLPRTRVHLSADPAGERIRAHLRLRSWGLPRFRLAQGVLHLPQDVETYLRGRSRQAVRTNMRRARERGIECMRTVAPDPTPCDLPGLPPGLAEHWRAVNQAGVTVGEAWLTIDVDCALLHCLGSSESDVRWLLHTAIVERLCAAGCRQLLTNSHDAFLMPAGQRYFQQLLGYSVERVQPSQRHAARLYVARRTLTSLMILAGVAAMGEQALAGLF